MESATFAFIALPAFGALVVGYLLTDWRLAGAVASGGFGLLLILPGTAPSLATFVLPALLGAAAGALVLLPYLRFLPDATVWGRMGVAIVAALVASVANISLLAGSA